MAHTTFNMHISCLFIKLTIRVYLAQKIFITRKKITRIISRVAVPKNKKLSTAPCDIIYSRRMLHPYTTIWRLCSSCIGKSISGNCVVLFRQRGIGHVHMNFSMSGRLTETFRGKFDANDCCGYVFRVVLGVFKMGGGFFGVISLWKRLELWMRSGRGAMIDNVCWRVGDGGTRAVIGRCSGKFHDAEIGINRQLPGGTFVVVWCSSTWLHRCRWAEIHQKKPTSLPYVCVFRGVESKRPQQLWFFEIPAWLDEDLYNRFI